MGLIELNAGTPEYEEFFKDVKRNKIEKFPNLNDHKEMETEEWKHLAGQYRIVKENLRMLEQMENEIKEKLIALSNNESSTGGGVSVTKVNRKGTIDYQAIPSLKNLNLELYRKASSEYWKVSIVELD